MLPIARLFLEQSEGHTCEFPAVGDTELANQTVFLNGQLALTVGSRFSEHGCPTAIPPHFPIAVVGSSRVSIRGVPAVLAYTLLDCGDRLLPSVTVPPRVFASL